jgi:hypothetical protein
MPKVSVEAKGSAPDASDYIAYKRRQALLRSQQGKNPKDDPSQKPIIGREFLNQKGFDSGILPWKFNNGKILDQARFR